METLGNHMQPLSFLASLAVLSLWHGQSIKEMLRVATSLAKGRIKKTWSRGTVRGIDIMWTARWQFMHLCTATARHAAQNMLPSARRTTIRMSRPWLRHKIDCKYGNRNNRRVSKIDWLESSGIDLLKAVPKEADGMACSLDSFDSFSFVFLAACDVQKIERPETQLGIVKSGGRADICTEARETHYRQQ
jgi:hypothetical protein